MFPRGPAGFSGGFLPSSIRTYTSEKFVLGFEGLRAGKCGSGPDTGNVIMSGNDSYIAAIVGYHQLNVRPRNRDIVADT